MRYSAATIFAGASLAAAQVPVWGFGIGWTGGTTCVSGNNCTYNNAYYSQCLLGSAPLASSTVGTTSTNTSTSTTSTAPSATATSSTETTDGLDTKFKAKGKQYFGVAIDQSTLSVARSTLLLKLSSVL
ncbi:hypothetical protein BGX38DRAFT_1277285 [Terfezia claveryi]|nr:hypothetical protein BGX38DRAFT_1277285 [Terfezia claveryi]